MPIINRKQLAGSITPIPLNYHILPPARDTLPPVYKAVKLTSDFTCIFAFTKTVKIIKKRRMAITTINAKSTFAIFKSTSSGYLKWNIDTVSHFCLFIFTEDLWEEDVVKIHYCAGAILKETLVFEKCSLS